MPQTTKTVPAPANRKAPPPSRPAGKAAPKAPAATAAEPRKVRYPELMVSGVVIPRDALRVTAAMMRDLLDWVPETDHVARELEQHVPGWRKLDEEALEAAKAPFLYGDDFLLTDEYGNKIRCLDNDLKNRSFRESWARSRAQDILTKNWRFNCETIIVSRTGWVQSGQHRAVGLILAVQMWENPQSEHYARWREIWGDEEPTIETLIAFGGNEDPETVRTLDNTLPRSEADVLETGGYFGGKTGPDRKECSRMLARAVDLLWARTRVGTAENEAATEYKTRSSEVEFLDRHPKLIEAVNYIFAQNVERPISGLKLSPGRCAGLLYLMGCAGSDGALYRNAERPSEKSLSWEHWDRAVQFWHEVAAGGPVLTALRKVRRPSPGQKGDEDIGWAFPLKGDGATEAEKEVMLVRAWNQFIRGDRIEPADLVPDYLRSYNDDGTLAEAVLNENPQIEGTDDTVDPVDCGEWRKVQDQGDDPASPEELAERAAAAKAASAAGSDGAAKKGRPAAGAGNGAARAPGTPPPVPARKLDKDGKPPAPALLKKPLHKREDEPAVDADDAMAIEPEAETPAPAPTPAPKGRPKAPPVPAGGIKRNAVQLKAREEARKADEALAAGKKKPAPVPAGRKAAAKK